ncbi:hypothetical protein [Acinetobacter baumannii]|uniref:hypothetical protein n=1 Tax=Acinetobacter baumannii TaxID=470 RepID=UPI0022EB0E92|nr:hypothetical protein [Acinetobacter baumannii]MDA3481450.1 hypothetical protein [Acinetobacter baumannii]WGT82044.1 hypothetical protein QE150_01550 [Acinetobacter baumannii]HEO1777100.1 hypothetical protein [Acinetobacter baumannii]
MKKDLAAIHHKWMLDDKYRINQYKLAIEKICKHNDTIVDLGCGTGVLTHLCKTKNVKSIIGIEYFEWVAKLFEKSIPANLIYKYKIENKSSFEVDVTRDNPTILITETIGQIGPEENIVESIFDFCQRHKTINKIIPSDLEIYIQPVYSYKIEELKKSFINSYLSSIDYGDNEKEVIDFLEKSYSEIILNEPIVDSILDGERILISHYKLGKTYDSSFEKKIDVSSYTNSNAIHIYFNARLDEEIYLSSYLYGNTHWGYSYIYIPHDYNSLLIRYVAGSGEVTIDWIK